MTFQHQSKWFWLVTFVVAMLVFGGLVMLLWNWLSPSIFNGPTITYWEALGLLALGRILTGRLPCQHHASDSGYRERWQKKWSSMTEEQKAALRQKYRNRCHSFREKDSDGE